MIVFFDPEHKAHLARNEADSQALCGADTLLLATLVDYKAEVCEDCLAIHAAQWSDG